VRIRLPRLSPATVIAGIALFAALSGAAIALPGRNSVDSGDLKANAVTSSDIRNKNVKTGDLANDAVTSAKVRNGGLNDNDIGDFLSLNPPLRLTATEAATLAGARTAAPETILATRGQLTYYAKCFRDTAADLTQGEIFVRTTADGSISQGLDELPGGDTAAEFLNTSTQEPNNEVQSAQATGNDANISGAESFATSPDGSVLFFDSWIAVKNGNLAGGNGLYGRGDVCLFGGQIYS
jgi:hypothetical protein